MKCTNCGEDIKQTEGKREKRFCNSTCRSGYWQKQKRKIAIIGGGLEIGLNADQIITVNRPLPKPKVKPSIQVLTPEVKVEFKPKTLAELKAKCPKGLDMFDKAKWIQDNRLKYGI